MADEPTKRVVKSPETFRERAVKASESPDKVKRSEFLRQTGGRVVRPVGVVGGKVVGFKPFRPLRKPFKLIGRILFPRYFRQSWKELRQVHWPSRRESLRLTFAVLVFAFVFGVIIAVVDYGLDKLFRNVLLK
ncbi:preprotein translocase subunit SecE [Candidatus Saccharibacteria bacterium CG_4_10_14_0_2_um_filter_52_9]|nr:MAG: preprotein translocase subunit SecE [Candidatus Saccharibacteria bacterium CG_4_10_14_0_2_um_filter_52_9]